MGVRGIFAIAVALALPVGVANAVQPPTLNCQRPGETTEGGVYLLSGSGAHNPHVVGFHYQRLTANRISCAGAQALMGRIGAGLARDDPHPVAGGLSCTLTHEAGGLRRASCLSKGGLVSIHFLVSSLARVTGQRAIDDATCIQLAGPGAPAALGAGSGCEVRWKLPQDQNEALLELVSSAIRTGGLSAPFTAQTPGKIDVDLDLGQSRPLASLHDTWTIATTSTAFVAETPAGHHELLRLQSELKRHRELTESLKLSLKFTPAG